jgi:hypothetical protein
MEKGEAVGFSLGDGNHGRGQGDGLRSLLERAFQANGGETAGVVQVVPGAVDHGVPIGLLVVVGIIFQVPVWQQVGELAIQLGSWNQAEVVHQNGPPGESSEVDQDANLVRALGKVSRGDCRRAKQLSLTC